MPAQKKGRRSGRRIVRGIFFLLLSGVILAVLVYVPIFRLNTIKLIGAEGITAEDVLRIGEIYIGEPLFRLETDRVAGRLKKDLRIEDAGVRRSLPGTLEVTVKERRPVATIVCDYGYLDLDKNGKVIAGYKSVKPSQIPLIVGATVSDLYIGDDVEDENVKKVLNFLQKLNPVSLQKISKVDISSPERIVAYTNGERTVEIRIGKIEREDEKAHLIDDFLQDLETNPHNIEFVDFNYTAPFIKIAPPAPKPEKKSKTDAEKPAE